MPLMQARVHREHVLPVPSDARSALPGGGQDGKCSGEGVNWRFEAFLETMKSMNLCFEVVWKYSRLEPNLLFFLKRFCRMIEGGSRFN